MKQRAAKNGQKGVPSERSNIALLPSTEKGVKRGMDPILLNETVWAFRSEIEADYGIVLSTSTDFDEFLRVRASARGATPQPAFNPILERDELSRTGFWVHGQKNGKTVVLIAYRLFDVKGNFRNWLLGWQVWAHTMLGEDVSVMPPQLDRPLSELVENLQGPVVYAGEMWLDQSERTKGQTSIVDELTHFGSLLVWQLWRPKAIFALTSIDDARAGKSIRTGFDCIEPAFLQWRRKPECVSSHEEILMITPEPRLISRVLDVQKRLFSG